MRLSEKTLELNICAQMANHAPGGKNVLWFGLTQRQEARAGFDACTRFGGRLLIFQFKAPTRTRKSGDSHFLADHNQLVALRRIAKKSPRSVFYAFPLVGSTAELRANPNLLPNTWLVDVANLSAVGLPTKKDGSLRKNGSHNVYVSPGKAVFHSAPVRVDATSVEGFLSNEIRQSNGVREFFADGFDAFWSNHAKLPPATCGLVVW